MAASPRTISAKPEAELVPRAEDLMLTSAELQLLELFGSLKKGISVEKFPGSIVLRRFHKGDVICRQGDRGHSAYYIVRTGDVDKLLQARGQATMGAGRPLSPSSESSVERKQIATAYVLGGPKPTTRPWPRLFPRSRIEDKPQYIPNDGPADVDYRTRQAPVFEGDVFGEMSCMTLGPRSATVVVDEDCYVVEFLRNIFDQMQRDEGYRNKIDAVYKERVLSTHLRRLEFFRGLTDAELTALHDAADLEVVDPGTIICDEGDPADSVYIVRSGVVQVLQGASVALRVEDITDWPAFCKALLPGAGGGGNETAASKASSAKTPTSSTATADILAAARRGKAAKPEASDKPSKKPSAADILAVARAKKADSQTNSTPATRGTSEQQENPGSVADVLGAARAPQAPATTSQDSPSAEEDESRLIRETTPKRSGDPRQAVWDWLMPSVQDAVRLIASGEGDEAAEQKRIVAAVNQLIRRRDFVASQDLSALLESAEVVDTVRSFPQGIQGAKKDWSELEIRIAGTLVMRVLYPGTFPRPRGRQGPPHILAYLTRGDCFGEMALVLNRPRQATCIAYDHPNDDPRRKAGRVELVKIDGTAFRQLVESSPALKSSVDQLVASRQSEIAQNERLQPWDARHDLTETEEFRDAGLVQGQSLLLIDLDRCTRCGDCVRACVNTHQDGYTRLFLEGPRFDRFLVPSACRQCLNPSCMIGCPVGSIQRGDNGQIEIRDWCIGCGLCARQCPYDSIQMHDIGLIPENAAGWMFAPASIVGGKPWHARRFRASGWTAGVSPFRWTLDLFEQLASRAPSDHRAGKLVEPICFRHAFRLSHDDVGHDYFRLLIVAEGMPVEAWMNGQAVSLQQDAKQKKKGEFEARVARSQLRRGENMLALQVSPPERADGEAFTPAYNQVILSARLDPVPEAGALSMIAAGEGTQLEMELVTEKAVVCDLCSQLSNQQPACVAQCPHDAAIRVNARFEFPLG